MMLSVLRSLAAFSFDIDFLPPNLPGMKNPPQTVMGRRGFHRINSSFYLLGSVCQWSGSNLEFNLCSDYVSDQDRLPARINPLEKVASEKSMLTILLTYLSPPRFFSNGSTLT